jgi:type 1 fimbriae regulatory protein FimE
MDGALDSVTRPYRFVTVRTGRRAISVGNARLRDGASTSVNVTVGKRSREYLTEREVERLIEAAKQNRSGHRDATAILVAYRHGLGASEVVVLRWDDSDLTTGRLHVRRAKAGDASVHPISARESRALRKLLRESPASPYVFISERRAPLSAAGYQRIVARAGVAAKFTFLVHSHMLRHACGFKLAKDGRDTRAIQAYLGHRSIMSTVRYTALTPNRFKNFWKD